MTSKAGIRAIEGQEESWHRAAMFRRMDCKSVFQILGGSNLLNKEEWMLDFLKTAGNSPDDFNEKYGPPYILRPYYSVG
jgi:hypothetical protein